MPCEYYTLVSSGTAAAVRTTAVRTSGDGTRLTGPQEIRNAGDSNQKAYNATMEAVRAAQMLITSLQIEAKNKDDG